MTRSLKLISTLCIMMLLMSVLAACGSKSNSSSANNSPDSSTNTSTETPTTSGEIPTLVWWTIGGQVPDNFEKAIEAMNE
ncbi:ABC transporter substrate-binding protein, partial [Salmonella enterica subsp. enterica]|nr:ABC transporter substrate-binding protein [Salmonella enterica subsp. enterica]